MDVPPLPPALEGSLSESCDFLKLARELRDMIYGHLLEIRRTQDCYPDGPANRYTLPDLAILATNKQIRDEAREVYGKVNQVVKVETDVDLASMEEPRTIGFLNIKQGQTMAQSGHRFSRLVELLGEAHLPRLTVSRASDIGASQEIQHRNLLVMLEDLPDLMLRLYLHQAMDGANVRQAAYIEHLDLTWELPQDTKALEPRFTSFTDCVQYHCTPISHHHFNAVGPMSNIDVQRQASVPMFRRPAWPLGDVDKLDGEASVLYWDERDFESALAVWRHAMSYLDIYAFEVIHCNVKLDDAEFIQYAELRFNTGLMIATSIYQVLDSSRNIDSTSLETHNDLCNLALAHLNRASSMLCTGLFGAPAEARLWYLYAKMSSLTWPAKLWDAEGAIEQACALDPGMPNYEKEHNDIYVISYATETGNLEDIYEADACHDDRQWTVFNHSDPESRREAYIAYRYLPESIAANIREKESSGDADDPL